MAVGAPEYDSRILNSMLLRQIKVLLLDFDSFLITFIEGIYQSFSVASEDWYDCILNFRIVGWKIFPIFKGEGNLRA